MAITLSPTQDTIDTALRAFLLDVVTPGTEVIAAQVNRVPEPSADDFCITTVTRRGRLSTNVDSYVDALFTGSIADTTLTITEVVYGELRPGASVFGEGLAAGTVVTAFLTGTGGVGTYTVSPTQTIASEQLAAGRGDLMQPIQLAVQIDIHGPASPDNAQRISTTLRDEYAARFFAGLSPDIAPLFATDPHQLPFLNAEQQYETRYVVDAMLQVNQTVTVSQEFASSAVAEIVNVDAEYPP